MQEKIDADQYVTEYKATTAEPKAAKVKTFHREV